MKFCMEVTFRDTTKKKHKVSGPNLTHPNHPNKKLANFGPIWIQLGGEVKI